MLCNAFESRDGNICLQLPDCIYLKKYIKFPCIYLYLLTTYFKLNTGIQNGDTEGTINLPNDHTKIVTISIECALQQ